MTGQEHPCARGLTKECFEKYPEWAKRAFAYKLMHTLWPPWLTRRLPKWLRLALIGDGVILPPGYIPPDGMTIPPNYTFPPGWSPGDPIPSGITIPAGTIFPPGWSPGDPLPPGVTIEPGAEFPPGWTPGDPIPSSFGPDPPPGIIVPPGGAIPPLYSSPGEPGPAHKPSDGAVVKPVTVEITSSIKDGHVRNDDADWSTARTTGTGNVVDDNDVNFIHAMAVNYWSGIYNVYRSFFYFDLSSIPAGKTISEVVLLLTELIYHKTGVAVFEGTQAATLTVADFGAFESTEFASQAFEDGENEIELNSDGIQFVQDNIGSEIKLCCRESDYDVGNVTPPASSNHNNGCYYADHSTAAYRPKLKVTYV